MLNLGDFTTATFAPHVQAATEDPAYVLSVPASNLLSLAEQSQFDQFFARRHKDTPKVHEHLLDVILGIASPAAVLAKKAVDFNLARLKHQRLRRPEQLFHRFTIERSFLTLSSKEKAVLAAVAELVARSLYTPDQWFAFIHQFAWGEGKGVLVPSAAIANDQDALIAEHELTDLIRHLFPQPGSYLTDAARDIAAHAGATTSSDPNGALLFSGARWAVADDLVSHPHYATVRTPPALFLGSIGPTGDYVYFKGHESLITVAGPGAGKSSALVIPNLLTYPGSVVVLDVKGELWDKTAAYRRANFGPVYRFAPTDPQQHTHRFNPMDFISSDPAIAAVDCEVFSQQVILDRADDKDPYWEGKARDYFWAFAFMQAVTPGAPRTISAIGDLMSLSTALDDPDDRSTAAPETLATIDDMRALAAQLGIPHLHHAADNFYTGLGSNRLESVLDSGRRHLSVFNRSALVRDAISTSDWSPLDLRRNPGTSLYICIDDPKGFGAIIRLLLYQHFRMLKDHVAHRDEPPITFFLDEMPRLGNFTSILEMQDIGRSAALRLWMFVQSYGQLMQNFGAGRAPGIIDGCRVRTFIEPQRDEMKFVQPALGERRNIFTGEKEPLATADELQGHRYANKIITTTRGSRPMVLDPLFAHASPGLSARIKGAPTVP